MSELKETNQTDSTAATSARESFFQQIKKQWKSFTAIWAVFAIIVTFLCKVYVFSKAEAMCIDRSWINYDTQYVIYTIMKSFILLIVYAAWNYCIYATIIKAKYKKILVLLFVILAFEFIYSICMVKFNFQPFELYLSDKLNFWVIIIASLILAVVSSFLGVYIQLSKVHTKGKEIKKSTQSKHEKVIPLLLSAAIYLLLYFCPLGFGADSAANQKHYKIYNGYVVLAENKDKLLCSKIKNTDYEKSDKLEFDCRQQYVFTIDPTVPIVDKRFATVKSNSKTVFELIKDGIE